jgi:1,4-alpha-glucan branching enzyme
MDFVLALHSHLPYVLNHGRWPHGTDWITEAAIDTYLPLIETLGALDAADVPAPVTIGFTPVLANQLESDAFAGELELFFQQRLTMCEEAPASLRETGDAHLVPLVSYWQERLTRLRDLFRRYDRRILTPFRELQAKGRLEIIGSAATHGFLPLLSRDESIRLHLDVGRREHLRIFGRAPRGCWVPECAYRSRGPWRPLPAAPDRGVRRGIEEHVSDAGFRYFFADSHMARAGSPLGLYGEVDTEGLRQVASERATTEASRSPYRCYRVSTATLRRPVATLIRDPNSSAQVWSKYEGYPGDGRYLDFHKIRWPGGLKLWRVTGATVDMGDKAPYVPNDALAVVEQHGHHFASLLGAISGQYRDRTPGVVVAPFDTELFGHWWHEGTDFIGTMYRALAAERSVTAVTASEHIAKHEPRTGLRLAEGSWGAHGDFSMWLNSRTEFTWPRIWELEDAFWTLAPRALAVPSAREPLAQAAREMLLLQSSDWQFIISTGAVTDYAIRRFNGHAADTEALIAAIRQGLDDGDFAHAENLTWELRNRDDLFPNILDSIEVALAGGRAHVAA